MVSMELEVFEQIGEGVSGRVFRGSFRRIKGDGGVAGQKQECAVKAIDGGSAADLNELEILKRVSAECWAVVDFYFCTRWGSHLVIGMELFVDDLFGILGKVAIDSEQMIRLLCQMANGIEQLHQHGVVHLDLKPENFGVTRNGNVKIFDFNCSVVLTGEEPVVSSSGTVQYASPEMFKREPVSYFCDWWSFGILVYEIVFEVLPFDGGQDPEVICRRICCEQLPIPKQVQQSSSTQVEERAFDLCQKLLEKDKSVRMTDFNSIKQHPLFEFVTDWNDDTPPLVFPK